MTPVGSKHATGFTLVEVLVAFVVVGLVAAVILPGLQTARVREQRSIAKLQALDVARAQLEELKLLPPDTGSKLGGHAGRWLWRAQLRLRRSPAPSGPRVGLREIIVEVYDLDADEPLMRLETQHLIALAPSDA